MTDNHEADPASPFAWVHLGEVITRFGEAAVRVHHAKFGDPLPTWFDPRNKPNQGGQHLNGFSLYWEVEINEAKREEDHPFDSEVAANAVHIEQLTLLG